MSIDWNTIGDAAVEELTLRFQGFLDQVEGVQKDRVLDTTRKLAEEVAAAIANPAEFDRHQRNVSMLVGTLQAESVLVQIRAEKAARQAVAAVINRVASLLLV